MSVVSLEVSRRQQPRDVASEDPVVGVQHSVRHSQHLLQAAEQQDSAECAAVHCCCQGDSQPVFLVDHFIFVIVFIQSTIFAIIFILFYL